MLIILIVILSAYVITLINPNFYNKQRQLIQQTILTTCYILGFLFYFLLAIYQNILKPYFPYIAITIMLIIYYLHTHEII